MIIMLRPKIINFPPLMCNAIYVLLHTPLHFFSFLAVSLLTLEEDELKKKEGR